MIIKKYLVNSMHQAVQQIKTELGPDAVIVNTQKVYGPGLIGLFKKQLEVTAVLDKNQPLPPALPQNKAASPDLINPSRTVVAEQLKNKQTNLYLTADAELQRTVSASQILPKKSKLINVENTPKTSLVAEFSNINKSGGQAAVEFKPLLKAATMKSLEQQEKDRLLVALEHQLTKMNKAGDAHFKRRWLQVLVDADIDQGIAKQLVEDLEQIISKYGGVDVKEADAAKVKDDLVKVALINRITELVEPAYKSVDSGAAGVSGMKCLAFIGPPGVGKTTTLAKLATRFKLLEAKKVALITVYTYRYGAADQLKIYGNTIDVPVEVVMTPAELRQAVEKHADKDYVLIDTVGRSSKNTGQVLEIKGFLEAINEWKQIYLVMSATTKDRDLLRIIKDFQIARYTGCIFTKTDETETLGSMLNIVLKTGVPLRYCTDGQVIPDDLTTVQPRNLAQFIFRGIN